MAIPSSLGPAELRDAFATIASVVSDHAAALDRLQRGSEWSDDPGALGDGAAPGSPAAGTDLSRSLAAACAAAAASPGSVAAGPLLDAMASAALEAASTDAGRGVAIVLDGLAESCRNADVVDAERVALGLELASERLAPADDGGHAGCLPAVLAAGAAGALSALDAGADLPDLVIAAADDGLAELEAGPLTNPHLVERGVVDAAAAGFLLVLDALASVLTGEPLPAPPVEQAEPSEQVLGPGGRFRVSCAVEPNEGSGIESASWLESAWFELGELERFEPGGARWVVSLVTPEPGRAIEVLCDVGRPRDLQVVPVSTGT